MATHSSVLAWRITSVMSNSVRPQRRQPTRLPHPWESPDENTEAGCHFLLQCMKVKRVKVKSLSCVRLLATPRTAAYQAPPSLGFSRQEYWSGVPLSSLQRSLLDSKFCMLSNVKTFCCWLLAIISELFY